MYRTNGSTYESVMVDVVESGSNIIIQSTEKFAGFVLTIEGEEMGLEGIVTVEKIRAAINASLSGLSNSDATITITKNDGTTSTITINNVANATTATTATKLGSSNGRQWRKGNLS